jgi:hypothetical protein|tara:strand:+ start:235 stop:1131 length:897 start_codon:yes stop_codon:yes gene_type:complete
MQEIKFDFETENGWVKMPLEAVMYNERLTGQARQLWAWLVSKKRYQDEMLWSHAEYKLHCGPSARRRSLQVLVEEGFVSVSKDGRVITMHDPEALLQKTKKQHNDFARNEFFRSAGLQDPKKKAEPKQEPEECDWSYKIIDAWNDCKPLSFAKMRVLSVKQKQSIEAHLRNLGLPKKEVRQFICSVCRGLAASEFWIKKVDTHSRTFKAVFGYGSPQDVKMKNVEDLYNDGDPYAEPKEPLDQQEYTPEQKALLEEIEVHNYEIDKNYNREEQKQRSLKYRAEAIAKLKAMGINVEVD